MSDQKRPRIRLMGDSFGDADGNHFVVRYGEDNKPNHFEINGDEVSEAEYRAARSPNFP